MNIDRFKAAFGREPGRTVARQGIRPITRPDRLPQAALDHYWHPDRAGVEPAPSSIAKVLASIHPKLRLVRAPMNAPIHHGYHPWILWFENPEVRHSLCPGWSLVFVWNNPETHEPLPMDNRFYANVYMRDPRRFTKAESYYDGCIDDVLRSRQRNEATFKDNTLQRQLGLRDYQKIKNIGMGNKFALHHDGTNIASRGETDWRTQTLYQRLPDEVRRTAEQEGKNTRARVSVSGHPDKIGAAIAARDFQAQLDMLALLRDRRERVMARMTRSSVGYTGPRR